MAATIRQAGNLTGLVAHQNPIYTLNRTYKKILDLLEKMPQHAAYRKHTEGIIKQRSSIVNSTGDIKTMEEKIGCGSIDELILQAKNELSLAQNFLVCRPWDNLVAPIPKNQWKWPAK